MWSSTRSLYMVLQRLLVQVGFSCCAYNPYNNFIRDINFFHLPDEKLIILQFVMVYVLCTNIFA